MPGNPDPRSTSGRRPRGPATARPGRKSRLPEARVPRPEAPPGVLRSPDRKSRPAFAPSRTQTGNAPGRSLGRALTPEVPPSVSPSAPEGPPRAGRGRAGVSVAVPAPRGSRSRRGWVCVGNRESARSARRHLGCQSSGRPHAPPWSRGSRLPARAGDVTRRRWACALEPSRPRCVRLRVSGSCDPGLGPATAAQSRVLGSEMESN